MKGFKNFKFAKLVIFSLMILTLISCPNNPDEPNDPVVKSTVLKGAFGETNTSSTPDAELEKLDLTSTKSFAYDIWILEVTDRTTREKSKYYVEWQKYLDVEKEGIDPNSEQGQLYEKIRIDLWKEFLIGTWEEYNDAVVIFNPTTYSFTEDNYTEKEELGENKSMTFSTMKKVVTTQGGNNGTYGANTYVAGSTFKIGANYFKNFTYDKDNSCLKTTYKNTQKFKKITN